MFCILSFFEMKMLAFFFKPNLPLLEESWVNNVGQKSHVKCNLNVNVNVKCNINVNVKFNVNVNVNVKFNVNVNVTCKCKM